MTMQETWGLVGFFSALMIVSAIAAKRGRSGSLFFLTMLVGGFLGGATIGHAGGTTIEAAIAAFLSPAVGFVTVLTMRSAQQLAVENGRHGAYRKCPFCAEGIRLDAIKCRYCGSDVEPLNIQQQH